ncbi:hypothetical protein [Rhizobium pisi]|uniref:hypothetical protein n=1 Tax=Rhizobium pisi TaxID=574561 RepID=UPI001ABFE614|nr:hypothetical protein [Rhizobium pisi]
MTSERDIVSNSQKATGIRGLFTGCFADAGDESGKLVFSGTREGFRSGCLNSAVYIHPLNILGFMSASGTFRLVIR